MRTSEILDLAADVIERRGWVNGGEYEVEDPWGKDGVSPVCLEGALLAVVKSTNTVTLRDCPAYVAMSEYLDMRPANHDFYGATRRVPIYEWNDEEGRTANEVIEALRGAAAVERVKEEALVAVQA